MISHCCLLISESGRAHLERIKNTYLQKILTLDAGRDLSLFVVFQALNNRILVRNTTDSHPEYGDEYIQFVVSDCENELSRSKTAGYHLEFQISAPQGAGYQTPSNHESLGETLEIQNGDEKLSYKLDTKYENLGLVKDVRIVKDIVEWTNGKGTYQVEADIAIIIDIENGNSVFLNAIDSLAGFIQCSMNRNILSSIKQQWQMKTDALNKYDRIVESI